MNIHCPHLPWLEQALNTGSLESVLRSYSLRDKRLRLLRRIRLIDGDRLRTVREWKTALDLLPSREEVAFEVLWDRLHRSWRPRGRPALEDMFRQVLVVDWKAEGVILITDRLEMFDPNTRGVYPLTDPSRFSPLLKSVSAYEVGGCNVYWIKLNDISLIDLENALHTAPGRQPPASVYKIEPLDHILLRMKRDRLFIGHARFDDLSAKDRVIEARYLEKNFADVSPEHFYAEAMFAARVLSTYKFDVFRERFGFPMPELGAVTRQHFLNFVAKMAPYHYEEFQRVPLPMRVEFFFPYVLAKQFREYTSRMRHKYEYSLLEATTLFGVTNVIEQQRFWLRDGSFEYTNDEILTAWNDGLTKTDQQSAWTVNVAPDSFLFALVLLRRDLLQTMLTVLRDYDYERSHSAAERLATEHYIPLLGRLLELLGRHGVESARDLPPEQQAKFVALALSDLVDELPNSICLSWPRRSTTKREDVRPAFLDNSSVFFLFRWYVPDRLPSDWRDRFSCINDYGFRCPGETWIKQWILSELYNELKNPHLLTIS